MKYDLSQHPYFVAWRDPESNVTSYILTERVAPVQENFYFTFECMSADGELMWFQATHPPGGGRSLAVVGLNPEAPFIKHWPNTGAGQGALTPDGRGCYVCLANEIWLWRVDEEPQRVCVLDAKWINHRAFSGLHGITLSADHLWRLRPGAPAALPWGTHQYGRLIRSSRLLKKSVAAWIEE